MRPYADSNFFTRLYYDASDHEIAEKLVPTVQPDNLLPVTWLHEIEVCNAFELHVFQFQKGGQDPRITPELAAAAHSLFFQDIKDQAFCLKAPVRPTDLVSEVQKLAQRYTAKEGYRSYDLIHIAQATLLNADTFWSFDKKANKLAVSEGLAVI